MGNPAEKISLCSQKKILNTFGVSEAIVNCPLPSFPQTMVVWEAFFFFEKNAQKTPKKKRLKNKKNAQKTPWKKRQFSKFIKKNAKKNAQKNAQKNPIFLKI